MAALVAAYPDFLAGFEGNAIVWKDGTRMAFDDGRGVKDFETRLAAPDLKDMFYAPYPLGRAGSQRRLQHRPRPRALPAALRQHIRRLHQGRGDGASRRRGLAPDQVWAAAQGNPHQRRRPRLQAVSDELDAARGDDAAPRAVGRHLQLPPGRRHQPQSAHGLGIAIDIAIAHADYWRWTRPGADGRYAYRNRVPWEIVEVFERHGFIWGGKWHHFDTMHFEYRPEIIAASK